MSCLEENMLEYLGCTVDALKEKYASDPVFKRVVDLASCSKVLLDDEDESEACVMYIAEALVDALGIDAEESLDSVVEALSIEGDEDEDDE